MTSRPTIPAVPEARRGRPRDPAVVERVLRAAAELLFEVGFEHTTIDEVARRAGVAKATVYRRWASKDDLTREAVAGLLDYSVPLPDTGTLEGDLRAAYTASVRLVDRPGGPAWVRTVAQECAREPRIAQLVNQGIEARTQAARALLDRAVARGEARPGVDVRQLIDLIEGRLLSRALGYQPMPDAAEIEELVRLTLHGIAR